MSDALRSLGGTFGGFVPLQEPALHGSLLVARARQGGGKLDVVIKATAKLPRPPDRWRFADAAVRLAALAHPGLVPVVAWGAEPEGPCWVAEEAVDGELVGSLVARQGPLAPDAAVALTVGLLEALACLHDAGLVHGAVGPEVTVLGRDGRARLLVSGVALPARELEASARALAPEVLAGAPPDRAADVYGAGHVLYLCLAGAEAIGGDDPWDVGRRQFDEVPSAPSSRQARVSGGLDRVVLRALAKDPLDRYPDARAFARALAEASAEVRAAEPPPRLPAPPPPPPPKPSEAHTVGAYRLVSVLGEGGMGTVWQAEHQALHRPCALKILRAQSLDAAGRERMRREMRVLARLSHPNVVRVFDGDDRPLQPWLAMELVAGGTLVAAFARLGPLLPAEAVWLGGGLLEALAWLHAHGVVHRDFKPGNVMLTPEGTPKLMDFGLALVGDLTRLTATGYLAGTIPYMAPEVLAGARADERSDLFQWALTVLEALSGRALWRDLSHADVVAGHRAARLQQTLAALPALPPQLAAVLAACLAEDKAERPADAEAALALWAAVEAVCPPRAGRLAGDSAPGGTVAMQAVESTDRGRPSAPRPSAPRTSAPGAPRFLPTLVVGLVAVLGALAVTRSEPPRAGPAPAPARSTPAPLPAPLLLGGPLVRCGPGFAEAWCRLSSPAEVEVQFALEGGRQPWERARTVATTDAPYVLVTGLPDEGLPDARLWCRVSCRAQLLGAASVRPVPEVLVDVHGPRGSTLNEGLALGDGLLVATDRRGVAHLVDVAASVPATRPLSWTLAVGEGASTAAALGDRLFVLSSGKPAALWALAPAARRRAHPGVVSPASLDASAGEGARPLALGGWLERRCEVLGGRLVTALAEGSDAPVDLFPRGGATRLVAVAPEDLAVARSAPVAGFPSWGPYRAGDLCLVAVRSAGRTPARLYGFTLSELAVRFAFDLAGEGLLGAPTVEGGFVYGCDGVELWRLTLAYSGPYERPLRPDAGEWRVPARGAGTAPVSFGGRLCLPRRVPDARVGFLGPVHLALAFVDPSAPDGPWEERPVAVPMEHMEHNALLHVLGLRRDELLVVFGSVVSGVRLPGAELARSWNLYHRSARPPLLVGDDLYVFAGQGRLARVRLAPSGPAGW